MPNRTKITLSEQERQLLLDTGWILTKRSVTDKVYQLLGQLAAELQEGGAATAVALPGHVRAVAPKIYRGENYRLLPYVLLDYPRYFKGDDVLAMRTLFWWGNFFSVTLQLGGACKDEYGALLQHNLATRPEEEIYICVNPDPWEHHFEGGNYQLLSSQDAVQREQLFSKKFVKLALRFPLTAWEEMPELLSAAAKRLLALLQA